LAAVGAAGAGADDAAVVVVVVVAGGGVVDCPAPVVAGSGSGVGLAVGSAPFLGAAASGVVSGDVILIVVKVNKGGDIPDKLGRTVENGPRN
jgi:hypothetical protein